MEESCSSQTLHNDMKVALRGQISEDTFKVMIICVRNDTLTPNEADGCKNVIDLLNKLETADRMSVGEYGFLSNLLERAGCKHPDIRKIIQDCSESIKGLAKDIPEIEATYEKERRHGHHDAPAIVTATGLAKDIPEIEATYEKERRHGHHDAPAIVTATGSIPYLIKLYQKDLSSIFVSTESFDACVDTLLEHHVLMITGPPGSGKTMIAQQLMMKLWILRKCLPYTPTEPQEYSKDCNPDLLQCFHIDDVFGSTNFVEDKYIAWVSLAGNMRDHLRSQNTYIVFTSRDNIFNENSSDAKNYDVFSHIINLSDDKFKLTERNKRVIFDKHARANQIGIAYKDIVAPKQVTKDSDKKTQEPMGYPQRVRLLCLMNNETEEARIRYFRHPMEFLSNIIASYREKDHLTYCILILLLMNDGKLSNSFFRYTNKSSKQVKKCMDICGLPKSTTMGALHATAIKLCRSFLILNNDCFAFQHESIMEATTLDFGRIYPTYILNWCSIQFLLERVFTKDTTPPGNEYVVILAEVMFPKLCRRLVIEIKGCVYNESLAGNASSSKGDLVTMRSISTYRIFRDPAFHRNFLQKLTSFHLLLATSSPRSPHFTFLFLAAASGQDRLVLEILSSSDVQQLPGFRDHLDHVLYAACYSGSSAIVLELLKAGAQADYRTAHSPNEMKLFFDFNTTSTTLMHAAYSGSAVVLQLILNNLQQQKRLDLKDHICISDDDDRTALYWWAVRGWGADTLQILVESGPDIIIMSTLFNSVSSGHEATIRALLRYKVDVHKMNDGCQTLLEFAVTSGHTIIAHILLSYMKLDDLDRWSVQSLVKHLSTKDSVPDYNKYVVILLPEKFLQVSDRLIKELRRCVCVDEDESRVSMNSMATCHLFRDSAFVCVFQCHLQATASLHLLITSVSPSSLHPTFLFLAAAFGQDTLIRKILSLSDMHQLPGFRDHLDHILYAACYSRSPVVVHMLLVAGARADYRTALAPSHMQLILRGDQWGVGATTCTTVMHAAYFGHTKVLRLIIERLQQQQVDVAKHLSISDNEDKTAVSWWSKGRRGKDALHILLEASTDMNASDKNRFFKYGDQTTLYLSVKSGDKATVRLPLEAGTDIYSMFNIHNRILLEFAIQRDHIVIADLLLGYMESDDLDRWSLQTLVTHLVNRDSARANKYVSILQPEKFPQVSERMVKEIRRFVFVERDASCGEGDASCSEGDASCSEEDASCSEGDASHGEGDASCSEGDASCSEGDASCSEEDASCSEGDASCSEGDASCSEGGASRSAGDSSDSMRSLLTCRVFRDTTFLGVFLRHLQDTASDHLLLASSSPDSSHPNFLFLAAASGQETLVHEVLSFSDMHQRPGVIDHLDRILYAACYSGSLKVMRMLLEAGAKVDYRTAYDAYQVNSGWWHQSPTSTTLMHAAYTGSTEILQLAIDYLKEQKVDVVEHLRIRDDHGNTALLWWVKILVNTYEMDKNDIARHNGVFRMLLKAGADVNVKDTKGQTALHHIAKRKDVNFVQLLVDAEADVNVMDAKGQTALHHAAEHNHVDIVQLLLKAGADVKVTNAKGQTALHFAAEGAFDSIVQVLVEAKADVNVRDKKGHTALHWAAIMGDISIISHLVKAMADVNVRDKKGQTALHWAAIMGDISIISHLVKAMADVNVRDKKGQTALHWAAIMGDISIIPHLVKAMADVNVRDKKGQTALHCAAARDFSSFAQRLMDAGADVNIYDNEGQTALHRAAERNNIFIAWLLVNAGADVHHRASSRNRHYTDQTSLEIAILFGCTNVANFISRLTSK